MARQLTLALAASLLVASNALAQQTDRPRTTVRTGPSGGTFSFSRDDGNRLVLGLSTSSGGMRDTLGLLVSSITAGGPAEKAGLEEGNRLVAINGVALRLNASDASDPEMAGVLGRRLQRELEKVKAGEAVTLSVHANGQTRDVKVTPVPADSLSPSRMTRARLDSRPTIGASIGGFGSSRDTLGVFVMAVAEDGPLAKAGIYEGSRIASINGVDLRVPVADIGDEFMTSARMRRLTREIEKLEPGANAELRVYSNGQYRNVTVKTVRRSELKQDASISIFGSGGAGAVFMPPMDLRFDDGRIRFEMEHLLNGDLRERIEDAMRGSELELRGLRERLRDDRQRVEPPKEPLVRGRSGADDETMPVEEVLKQLEQRLRELDSSARQTFRSASVPTGTRLLMSPVAEPVIGTFTIQPAVAQTSGSSAASVDLQGVSPAAGAQGTERVPPVQGQQGKQGAQGRHGGVSTYRSNPAAQGGVFMIDGIRMSPINAGLASYLGRGSERGLLVLETGESWTGIEAGDVVLAIDGKAVLGSNGIYVSLREDREQSVDVLRAGNPLKVTLRRK